MTTKETDGATWSVAGLDARGRAGGVASPTASPAYGGTPSDESRHPPDPGPEGARSRGRALSLRDDGRARRQHACRIPTAAPASRPIPGAGASPAIPRRAEPARPTAPLRRQRRSNAGSRGLRASAAWCCIMRTSRRRRAASSGFILGSELVGLTRVRSASGVYPAVARAAGLGGGGARDPRRRHEDRLCRRLDGIRRACARRRRRGALSPRSALRRTPTSTRSASTTIRRSPTGATAPDHADLAAARSVYDVDYLRGRLGSGEAFDWYYADASDAQRADAHADHRRRLRQAVGLPRRRISSPGGRTGMWSAWTASRSARPPGSRNRSRSGSPRSAFPAVDKGPNGPNVFPDPKSSESAYPPFSRGVRDDLVQARGAGGDPLALRSGAQRGFAAALQSGLAGLWRAHGRSGATSSSGPGMRGRFPAFPDFDIVWADGANWETGHWITGRIEGAPLDRLIARDPARFRLRRSGPHSRRRFRRRLCDRPADVGARRARAADCASSASMRWRRGGAHRAGRAAAGARSCDLTTDDLVLGRQGAGAASSPARRRPSCRSRWRSASPKARRITAAPPWPRAACPASSRREARADGADRHPPRRGAAPRRCLAAGSLGRARERRVRAVAAAHRARAGRRDRRCRPMRASKLHRIVRIADGPTRKLTHARGGAGRVRAAGLRHRRVRCKRPPPVPGKPLAVVLDLPVGAGRSDRPAIYRGRGRSLAGRRDDLALRQRRELSRRYRILDLPAIDRADARRRSRRGRSGAGIRRRCSTSTFRPARSAPSTTRRRLPGGNLFALQGADGRWEIFSAARAELIGERSYRLSRLLRGLARQRA